MQTSPSWKGLGPACIGVGPACMGVGPACMGVGPACMGVGPACMGVLPGNSLAGRYAVGLSMAPRCASWPFRSDTCTCSNVGLCASAAEASSCDSQGLGAAQAPDLLVSLHMVVDAWPEGGYSSGPGRHAMLGSTSGQACMQSCAPGLCIFASVLTQPCAQQALCQGNFHASRR